MVRCMCKGQGQGRVRVRVGSWSWSGVKKGEAVHRWCGRVGRGRGQTRQVITGKGQRQQYFRMPLSLTGPKRPQNCPVQAPVHRKKNRRKVMMQRKCRGVRVCWGNLLKVQRGHVSHRKAKVMAAKPAKRETKNSMKVQRRVRATCPKFNRAKRPSGRQKTILPRTLNNEQKRK
jgi:hypothetical protein